MTWEAVAAEHIDTEAARHRGVLLDVRSFRCLDCKITLSIPREPSKVAVTGPPPYRRPDTSQAASPELIALRKREALAAVELARQKRTTKEET